MFQEPTVRFRLSLVAVLKVVSLFAAFATCAVVFTVSYRLWIQTTSQPSTSFPGDLLYAFGQILVAPFTGFDKTRPIRETAVLDIAVLTALEVYLVAGSVVIALAWMMSRLWPPRMRTLLVEIDLAPAQREMRALGRWLRAAGQSAAREASASEAWLRARDWSRLRLESARLVGYVQTNRTDLTARLSPVLQGSSDSRLPVYELDALLLRTTALIVSGRTRQITSATVAALTREGTKAYAVIRSTSKAAVTSAARRWQMIVSGRQTGDGAFVSRREFLRRVLIHG